MVENDPRGKSTKPKDANYNYGQLQFGKHTNSPYKISLRTFFGNPESEVFSIRFDDQDTLIAASNSDGSIKVFNLQTGKLVYQLSGYSTSQQTPTTCVRFLPKSNGGILYTSNADGSIMDWGMKKGTSLELTRNPCPVYGLDFNNEGTKFVAVGKDFHVRVYDTNTKQVDIDFPLKNGVYKGTLTEYSLANFCLKVSIIIFYYKDPNIFITCGWDPTAQIWDLRERKVIGSLSGPSVSADSLDYKNGQVLTGSYRNQEQLQIFDFKSRSLIKNIKWNGTEDDDHAYLYCSQFSKFNSETLIAGSSGINELKIFQTSDYMPVASVIGLHEGVYASDYSSKGNKFAFGGGEGVVYIMGLTKVQEH